MAERRAAYAHPLVLAALAVLLVNDHVLKARFPGLVTGKLSDVAGPVVAAALLGAVAVRVTARARAEVVAWWAVAAAFAAVKLVPAANAAAETLLTALVGPSAIVRDPADVLCLAVLPLAWRVTRSAPRRAPAPVRVAAAALALGAVAATSAAQESHISKLQVRGDVVEAVLVDETFSDVEEWRTTDGLTWMPAPVGTRDPSPPVAAGTTACASTRCYRITAVGIEESDNTGDTWRTSRRLADSSATSVAFVPGTDIAVVAVGKHGVLRRAGDGPWQAVGVSDAEPPTGQLDIFAIGLYAAVGVAALLVLIVVPAMWFERRRVQPAGPTPDDPWVPFPEPRGVPPPAPPPGHPPPALPPGPPPPAPPPGAGPGRYRRR